MKGPPAGDRVNLAGKALTIQRGRANDLGVQPGARFTNNILADGFSIPDIGFGLEGAKSHFHGVLQVQSIDPGV